MKKIKIDLKDFARSASLTAAGLALGLTITASAAPAIPTNYYPTAAEVVQVDYDCDTVVVSDAAENLWSFYGTEDWMPGDIVAMIMDNNGTADIHDDRIVSIRYARQAGHKPGSAN